MSDIKNEKLEVYTMEDWERDGSLKIIPRQEICEEIYYDQMNCLPPKSPDINEMMERIRQLEIPVENPLTVECFLTGEPYTACTFGYLYSAYCHTGGKYWHLGLMKAANDSETYY